MMSMELGGGLEGWERTQFDDGAAVDPAAKVKVVRDRKSENQLFIAAGTSF